MPTEPAPDNVGTGRVPPLATAKGFGTDPVDVASLRRTTHLAPAGDSAASTARRTGSAGNSPTTRPYTLQHRLGDAAVAVSVIDAQRQSSAVVVPGFVGGGCLTKAVVAQMVEVVQAYRFALDPTTAQAEALASHCGGSRVAFNTMLAAVKANLDQRTAERSYGVLADELTPSMDWSAYSLRKEWNRRKDVAAPWWGRNSKEAYSTGCAQLAAALSNWAGSKKGKRESRAVGFPRFKSKRRSTPSCTFTTSTIRVEADRKHVTLPRLGAIKTHESTRALARRLELGTARIGAATISYRAGRWYVSFVAHVQRHVGRPSHVKVGAPVVGIDLGLKHLMVVATPAGGVQRIPAPKYLRQAETRLRALQRKAARQHGPWDNATRRKRDPSRGWAVTQAKLRAAHRLVAAQRLDHLHKTTTMLAQRHDVIGVETLAVANMMAGGGRRKRGLNRSLGDASLGMVLRMLDYKTSWYGSRLVKADRFYPSSKTCSACGAVKAKLSLAERTYECLACGAVLDRDDNAGINLARLAAGSTTAGSASVINGGADRQTTPRVAGGYEARTRSETLSAAVGAPHRQGAAA